jgi:dipeptidyl aminopeptidase/acylaminoacyl peptidase
MRITLITLFLIIVSSCSLFQSSDPSNIPLTSFFKNSKVTGFRISPDGKSIAALMPYKDRLNVFVRKLDDNNWRRLTNQTDRDISNSFWKGNKHILFSRDFGGDENYHLFSINIETGKEKDLTPFKNTRVSVLDMLDGISKTSILIRMNKRNKQIFDVYNLNVENEKLTEVLRNPGNHRGWVLDHTGLIRVALTSDGVNQSFLYRDNEKMPFKTVIKTNFKQALNPFFFDAQNKYIYATSNLSSNTSQAILLNPKTGKRVKLLHENKNYDITGISYSNKLNRVVQTSYTDTKYRVKHFSTYYKNIYKQIESEIKDKQIYLTSHDKDERIFTVYVTSDRLKGVYYLYDADKKKLTFLENPSPWLDESKMSEMRPYTFTSRDGLKIEGYLTLPKGKESVKNLPMIVNPHGGPWARDMWGYNSQVQFLASRGYAVLQVNFRGSTGYGREFWESSFKQWGKSMQDDVTDAVKWAISKGHADPKRICIYGGSYGGYATLAGLTYTPDLYQCGIDYVGVSNLFTFMGTIPPYWKPYLKMLHEMVGHPVKDKKLLQATSPVFHVDKIKVPLFIAQGAKDPRVNKDESDQMVKALRERGIEVPYLLKENEGHGFHNQENRIEFYTKMEKFLKKHI